MGIKDTILVGCEIICIGEQSTDLLACPLSQDERGKCQQRRQYEAGRREVVEFIEAHGHPSKDTRHWEIDRDGWQDYRRELNLL